VPFRRRLLTWVVLTLVVVVGVALGRTSDLAAPSATPVPAAVAPALAAVAPVGDAVGAAQRADHGDGGAPCVVRSDCAGAWAFGATGLLLAVAVTVPAVGVVPTVRRVAAAPSTLHPALLPSGLFRPPQAS
jgi:hypothetical protein